ncbi:hypothetical protein C9374_010300 [Naegleria lovaniensis]|uniref:Actin-related protein 2/3 complex subunit 4 n=1 Tax=Naegleria lovaniensis TaxID=51637 RepID=A0AA88GIU3_NAELO|nr:uncharacterized protein C9374_010300 [Naegleria lovaniensis]KAG2374926.1 hypothetical protein C9374_010300 [Naegleria lovaniensis]
MSLSYAPYHECIRKTLQAALCLENFQSQIAERHNHPEIEVGLSKEVLLNPVIISRNTDQKCLIEGSINSVRISLLFKKHDRVEEIIFPRYMQFLMNRAEEDLILLRKKPIQGYDISFLITNYHTRNMFSHKIIDFILSFMEDVDKDIKEHKLFLNVRGQAAAKKYLRQFI